MPDIDNLSIKIKADSDIANKALSDLIANLGKMTSALQSVGKADGILGFEKAAKTLSNAFSGNIEKEISDIGNKFSNLGESAKRALKPMQSIGKLELKDLENQLSEVNAKITNAEKAVASVQNRTTAHGKSGFKATEAIEAENALNAYKKQRQEIESQIQEVQNASRKLEQLNLNLKSIPAPTIGIEGAKQLNKEYEKTLKALSDLKNKLSAGLASGRITESADDTTYLKIREQIAIAEKTAEALKMRIAEVRAPSSKLLDNFKSIAKWSGKIGSKFASMLNPFKKMTSASKGMNVSLAGGFKTVLKYAFGIRSLFTLFNKLRNAVKEGMKNLVQYSDETNASVSMLKNSLTQLKNSVAAAVSPLLNALAPALDVIIQLCVKATNSINQLISALLGKGSWIHAKKLTDNYAESLKGASKAAEKVQKGVRAFDELNLITTPDDNDGGSGAGTAATDMFETLDVEKPFSDLAERIKEMWAKADFTELGAMVGGKIKAGLDSIEWGTIQGNVARVSKSLATFINGLVEVEGLGYTAGTSLGNGFNTALIAVNTFLDNTHWDSIGQFIGEGLNGLFDTVDWEEIGHFFAQRLNAIFTALENIITTFDWIGAGTDLANALNTYFSDTDWDGIGRTVVEGINSIFALLTSFISEVDWYGIVADLMSMVTTAIQTFNWAGFGAFISEEVSALLDMVLAFILETDWGGTIQNVIGGIGDFIAHINWGELLFKIVAAIDGIIIQIPSIVLGAVAGITDFIANIFSGLGLDSVAGFFKGISDKLTNLRNWLKENLVDPFVNGVKALFGIHSPSTVMAEMGGYLMEGLFNGISALVDKVVGIFGDIKEKISGKWDEIKTNTLQTWESIKTTVGGKWDELKTNASKTWDSLKTTVGSAWENVKESTSKTWGSISGTLSGKWSALKVDSATTWNNISTTVSTKWNTLKTNSTNTWQNIYTTVSGKWNAIKSNTTTALANIGTTVTQKWNNVKTNTTKTWSNVSSTMSTKLSGIFSNVSRIFGNIYSTIKSKIENARDSVHNAIEKIKSFFNFSWSLPDLSLPHFSIEGSFSLNPPSVPHLSVDWYASGGYIQNPHSYSLFGMGENGIPEILGTVGGSPAVAGGQEITGISDTIRTETARQNELLRQQNELLQAILQKEYGISKDDIGKAARDYSREYFKKNGKPAFAY